MNPRRRLPILLLTFLLLSQLVMVLPICAVTITTASVSPSTFSPDGNSLNDTTTITVTSDPGQSLYTNFFNQSSAELVAEDRIMTESPSGTYKYTWNGKDDSNIIVEEGTYTIRISDNPSQNGDTIGTVSVDLTPPSSPSLSIAGGATYTTSRNVTLTISATGASQMKISNTASYSGATWETYATTKSWTLTATDGTKTVYINFRDTGGANTSTSDSITLDTTLSDPTLSINSGASSTNNRNVTLTITASDATYMKIDNNTNFANMSSWIVKTDTYSFKVLSGADGVRTVYLRVKDDAGNVKTTSDTITLDTTAPTNLSFSMNSGNAYTNSTSVTLTVSASGGPYRNYFSNTGTTYTGYTYATSQAWTLTSGDATKTVYYKAADEAGNNATAITATITLDTTAPSPVLLLTPSDGATETTQTPTFTWSDPNPSGTKNFYIYILQSGNTIQSSSLNSTTTTYTSGTLSPGTYSWRVTVYDMANNSIATSQQSFTVSITGLAAPTPQLPSDGARVNDTTPTITWAQVSGIGINYDVKYGLTEEMNRTATSLTTLTYSIPITYSNGQTIYWEVRARNTSQTSSYSTTRSFVVDTSAPTGLSISINGGAATTQSTTVTLTLSATNASYMMVSQNADFSGAIWETYATSKTLTLTGMDGTKTVYFKAKDNAGLVTESGTWSTDYSNIAGKVTDTISLNRGNLSTPTPTYPTNGTHVNDTTPRLRWSTVSGGGTIYYQYRYGLASDNQNHTGNTTSLFIDTSSYSNGQTIYWSLRAWNTTTYSEYCATRSFIVDTQAPTSLSVSINIGNSYTTSRSVTLTVSATSATQMMVSNYVNFSGGSWETYSTSKSWTLTTGDGIKTVYFKAKDNATQDNGTTYVSAPNIAAAVTDTIIYDIGGPTISNEAPTADSTITNTQPEISADLNDSGLGINTSKVYILVDGTNQTTEATIDAGSISYTPSSALEYDTHTVNITAYDDAGHAGYLNWSFTVEQQTGGGPGAGGQTSDISITGVSRSPSMVTNVDVVNISATVTATAGISRVRLYYSYGTTSTSSLMSNSSGSKYYARIGPFQQGVTVSYYIHAIDAQYNTEDSVNYTFTVQDRTPPVITIVSPENNSVITDRTPTISAAYTDAGGINTSSVTLLFDGIDVTDESTITSSQITYSPLTQLSYKEYTVQVEVSDTGGNQAIATWAFTVIAEEQELTETIASLPAGQTVTVDFSDRGTALQSIRITAANALVDVTVQCTVSGQKPSDVSLPSNAVYLYFIFECSASASDISSAVISFKVEQAWLKDNAIDKTSVQLLRYSDTGWVELTPTLITEDSTSVYYEASTPGFSTFVVTGIVQEPAAPQIPLLFIAIIIIVLGIIALVVMLYYRGVI